LSESNGEFVRDDLSRGLWWPMSTRRLLFPAGSLGVWAATWGRLSDTPLGLIVLAIGLPATLVLLFSEVSRLRPAVSLDDEDVVVRASPMSRKRRFRSADVVLRRIGSDLVVEDRELGDELLRVRGNIKAR